MANYIINVANYVLDHELTDSSVELVMTEEVEHHSRTLLSHTLNHCFLLCGLFLELFLLGPVDYEQEGHTIVV